MKKIIPIFIIILISSFLVGSFVLAADSRGQTVSEDERGQTVTEERNKQTTELENPLGTKDISQIVGRLIRAFLGVIGTISLVIFIYAGFLLLTSQGNPVKIKAGQQAILWATIGILVVFASYAILKFVFSVVGV